MEITQHVYDNVFMQIHVAKIYIWVPCQSGTLKTHIDTSEFYWKCSKFVGNDLVLQLVTIVQIRVARSKCGDACQKARS